MPLELYSNAPAGTLDVGQAIKGVVDLINFGRGRKYLRSPRFATDLQASVASGRMTPELAAMAAKHPEVMSAIAQASGARQGQAARRSAEAGTESTEARTWMELGDFGQLGGMTPAAVGALSGVDQATAARRQAETMAAQERRFSKQQRADLAERRRTEQELARTPAAHAAETARMTAGAHATQAQTMVAQEGRLSAQQKADLAERERTERELAQTQATHAAETARITARAHEAQGQAALRGAGVSEAAQGLSEKKFGWEQDLMDQARAALRGMTPDAFRAWTERMGLKAPLIQARTDAAKLAETKRINIRNETSLGGMTPEAFNAMVNMNIGERTAGAAEAQAKSAAEQAAATREYHKAALGLDRFERVMANLPPGANMPDSALALAFEETARTIPPESPDFIPTMFKAVQKASADNAALAQSVLAQRKGGKTAAKLPPGPVPAPKDLAVGEIPNPLVTNPDIIRKGFERLGLTDMSGARLPAPGMLVPAVPAGRGKLPENVPGFANQLAAVADTLSMEFHNWEKEANPTKKNQLRTSIANRAAAFIQLYSLYQQYGVPAAPQVDELIQKLETAGLITTKR